MFRGYYCLLMACMVGDVLGLNFTTLSPGETLCQEGQEICTDNYDSSQKNVVDSRVYYDCVWEVACLKHHRGYITRLELLSQIDDILEAQHEDRGNWWENGACSINKTLYVWISSSLAIFKILHGGIN